MFYYITDYHTNRKCIYAVKAKIENCTGLITQPVNSQRLPQMQIWRQRYQQLQFSCHAGIRLIKSKRVPSMLLLQLPVSNLIKSQVLVKGWMLVIYFQHIYLAGASILSSLSKNDFCY